uniref:Domain of unknown function at the cortex 1 domain-containing protein n=1 Tax=Ditylum brightwellii TaxID=49249 RepID=A0A7S1ZGX8_9STRA
MVTATVLNQPPSPLAPTATLPLPATWTHRPILLRTASSGEFQKVTNESSITNINCGYPLGVPFNFESDLFQGKILFRVRGLGASHDKQSDEDYFKGRKRVFQTVIQGKFKKEIPVRDLMFGMESTKPLKAKPPVLINKGITALLKKVSPDVEMDLLSDTPFVLTTFAGGAQTIRVDNPGCEPDILSRDIQEENRGFGQLFMKENASSAKRKKILSNPKFAADYVFNDVMVYTFDQYDDVFDLAKYKMKFGRVVSIGMDRVMDEPHQVFAKTRGGEYLWNFEIWHERLYCKYCGEENQAADDDDQEIFVTPETSDMK